MFKSVDKKFEEIGFKKVSDDEHGVVYERECDCSMFKYTHVLAIEKNKSGHHLIFSYDKDSFDNKKIGNVCVGLTGYEMKLALKKMKQKKLYSK